MEKIPKRTPSHLQYYRGVLSHGIAHKTFSLATLEGAEDVLVSRFVVVYVENYNT